MRFNQLMYSQKTGGTLRVSHVADLVNSFLNNKSGESANAVPHYQKLCS